MPEERAKRKLAAILSADVVGYSRLMEDDEEATVRTLNAYREAVRGHITGQNGRVVDAKGDNVLAEFRSVVDALRCAVDIQREVGERNAELPEARRMQFRIGVNLGDVIEEKETIYGDGVNIAARLEALADPGGIAISGTAFDSVGKKLPLGYEFVGEQQVKNIERPIRVYRVLTAPEHAGKVMGEERRGLPKWQRSALAALAGLVLLSGAFTVWNYLFRPPGVESASLDKMKHVLPDKPSIAVIPFENVSGETSHDSLAYGLSSNITTTLAKSARLFVIAIESAAKYRGKSPEVRQASEDLGVQYVLRGEVLAAEKRLRISTQLYDALTGKCKWAERYDVAFGEFFDTLDRITLAVAKEISVEVTHGEQLRKSKGTKNLDAFLLTQQAWDLYLQVTKEKNLQAQQLYERALELDPNYADALSRLAEAISAAERYKWLQDPAESSRRKDELIKKAIEVDDTNSLAITTMAIDRRNSGEFDTALSLHRKAIEANPNDDYAHFNMGATLYFSGNFKEAVLILEKAVRLSPFCPSLYLYSLGRGYYLDRQYEKAIKAFKEVLDRSEEGGLSAKWPHIMLSQVYAELDRMEEARFHMEKLLQLDPKFNIKARRKQNRFKNSEDNERELAALRKAGAPERAPSP